MDQLDRCGRKKGNNSSYTRLIHADSDRRLITSENDLNLVFFRVFMVAVVVEPDIRGVCLWPLLT